VGINIAHQLELVLPVELDVQRAIVQLVLVAYLSTIYQVVHVFNAQVAVQHASIVQLAHSA
jgi:hypothetical protein